MPTLFQQIQAGTLWDFHGGIHPPARKAQTSGKPLVQMPLPDRLYIPLRQHIGVAGRLIVSAGQRVLKGQPLTVADNSMAVPVHAPTSGTVLSIEPHTSPHPSALPELTLVLAPDALDAALHTLVDRILSKPREAVAMGKTLFYRQLETGIESAYQLAGQTMACNMVHDVAQEGVQAFIDKRAPSWRA